MTDTEARERRWIPQIKKWIDAHELAALKLLAENFKRLDAKYSGWGIARVRAAAGEDVKAITPDTLKFEEMIIDAAGKLHTLDFKEAGNEALIFLGLEASFNMENPAFVAYLGEKSRLLGTTQVKLLADRLETILKEGVVEGLTVAEMTEQIREMYDFERGYRAAKIARTEVISASNRARSEGFKQAGVKMKSWSSARDGNVRTNHQLADEKYSSVPIPIDEPFVIPNSNVTTMEPGNSNEASEDIGCRCTTRPENPPDE